MGCAASQPPRGGRARSGGARSSGGWEEGGQGGWLLSAPGQRSALPPRRAPPALSSALCPAPPPAPAPPPPRPAGAPPPPPARGAVQQQPRRADVAPKRATPPTAWGPPTKRGSVDASTEPAETAQQGLSSAGSSESTQGLSSEDANVTVSVSCTRAGIVDCGAFAEVTHPGACKHFVSPGDNYLYSVESWAVIPPPKESPATESSACHTPDLSAPSLTLMRYTVERHVRFPDVEEALPAVRHRRLTTFECIPVPQDLSKHPTAEFTDGVGGCRVRVYQDPPVGCGQLWVEKTVPGTSQPPLSWRNMFASARVDEEGGMLWLGGQAVQPEEGDEELRALAAVRALCSRAGVSHDIPDTLHRRRGGGDDGPSLPVEHADLIRAAVRGVSEGGSVRVVVAPHLSIDECRDAGVYASEAFSIHECTLREIRPSAVRASATFPLRRARRGSRVEPSWSV